MKPLTLRNQKVTYQFRKKHKIRPADLFRSALRILRKQPFRFRWVVYPQLDTSKETPLLNSLTWYYSFLVVSRLPYVQNYLQIIG